MLGVRSGDDTEPSMPHLGPEKQYTAQLRALNIHIAFGRSFYYEII
jgi:hypothetical protein